MKELSHRHYESIYYHPITRMCYRKKTDGFEFFKEWRAFRGNIWQKSGMKRGFELINKEHIE